jgi:23S rRNA (uracil1939-C5)-methyltransferase
MKNKQTDTPVTAETKPHGTKFRIGQVVELAVPALDEDGFGIARHEGKNIIVSGALPGEEVQAKITFAGFRETRATTVRILRHAKSRLISAPCPKLGNCDGCPLMLMKYPAQLAWKHTLVTREIQRYQPLQDATIQELLPSPSPLQYRNSAKLVIAGKFTHPVIGIYRRNTHEAMDIGDCPLHHPLINKTVAAVKAGIRKGKVSIYSTRSESGLLRYLVVRVSEATGKVMVVFVTAQRAFNEIHHLAKFVQAAVPEVEVVVQNVNSSTGNVILGQQDHFVTKATSIVDAIGPIRFSISPRSFFQVNGGGARIIYEKVLAWSGLTGSERVLDLYCGVGGISLFLAAKAHSVLGIEVVDAAVDDAERNARLNGITNCSFEAGDAAHLLHDLHEEGETFDLIVLNPPRKGCDEAVLQAVAAIAPARMIYVSCSPKSLARDLDILAGLGYRTVEVQPVDMFPQTPHVEDVALLRKEPSPSP